MKEFIFFIKGYLTQISEESFIKEKDALITKIMESPKKLLAYKRILWNEIDSYLYHFDRDQNAVNIIRELTKSDVIEFYEVWFLNEFENINHDNL